MPQLFLENLPLCAAPLGGAPEGRRGHGAANWLTVPSMLECEGQGGEHQAAAQAGGHAQHCHHKCDDNNAQILEAVQALKGVNQRLLCEIQADMDQQASSHAPRNCGYGARADEEGCREDGGEQDAADAAAAVAAEVEEGVGVAEVVGQPPRQARQEVAPAVDHQFPVHVHLLAGAYGEAGHVDGRMHQAEAGESDHRGHGLEDEIPPHEPQVEEGPEDPKVRVWRALEEPAARAHLFLGDADEQHHEVEAGDDADEEEGREERPADEAERNIQQGDKAYSRQPERPHARSAVGRHRGAVPAPGHATGDLDAGLGDEDADAANASYDEVAWEVAHRLAELLLAQPHVAATHDESGHRKRYERRREGVQAPALCVYDALGQGVHEGDVLHHHQAQCAGEATSSCHHDLPHEG
mmetsp:Transcript_124255/g.362746  ORF Transcript_124255/g.362746 Transcript_124255/m.362746 type:complete len:411 (-) Transcript_124255:587-1819(-)